MPDAPPARPEGQDLEGYLSDRVGQITSQPTSQPPQETSEEAPKPNGAVPAENSATEASPQPEETDEKQTETQQTQQDTSEDEEDFQLSWEKEKQEKSESPTESSTPETPEAKPARDLSEVREDILSQLGLDEPDKERVWGLILQTSRGRRALEQWKEYRDIEKPFTEGGLGFKPSIDDLREMVQTKIAWEDMAEDFNSGDPNRVADFLSFWLGPDQEGQLKPGAEHAATNLPGLLASSPATVPLYNVMAHQFLNNYANYLYQMGEQESDKDKKEWAINTARGLDWHLNGTWRKDSGTGKPTPAETSRPNGTDPRLMEEIRRRDEEIRRLRESQNSSFTTSLNSEIDNIIGRGVDEALAVVQKVYPEPVYNAVRADFLKQVRSHVESQPMFQREHARLQQQAFQSGDPMDREAVLNRYRQQAGAAIKRHRQQFLRTLKNTSAEQRQESDKRRQILEQSQNKVGPVAAGQPVSGQAEVQLDRQPGESMVDWYTRRIAQSARQQGLQ